MKPNYDCIIFDVDGTMIDTRHAVFTSYQRVIFEEFNRYFTDEELRVAYGVPTEEALARLGFKNVSEAHKKYHRYLMEAFSQVQPFEGIIEILEILREEKIITGIVTSRDKDEVLQDKCLQKLIKHFDYVVCSNDTEKHKPNPEPVLKLLELAKCENKKVLYIGDTHYDYMCAKNAGVDFALALWGAENTEDIHADYNLEKVKDLFGIIFKD